MSPLEERITKLMAEVPYDDIRQEAYQYVKTNVGLKESNEDIRPIIGEARALFAKKYAEQLARDVIHMVIRQGNKVLCEGVKDWLQAKMFNEQMASQLESIDLGDAATA